MQFTSEVNDGRPDPRATGRIGGLTAWSRHGSERLLGGAHAATARKFEMLVDPDGVLTPEERAARASRARRAHMLTLAQRSALARRARRIE